MRPQVRKGDATHGTPWKEVQGTPGSAGAPGCDLTGSSRSQVVRDHAGERVGEAMTRGLRDRATDELDRSLDAAAADEVRCVDQDAQRDSSFSSQYEPRARASILVLSMPSIA